MSLLPLLPVSRVPEEEPLHEMLNLFQATGVHTALVDLETEQVREPF